MLKILLFLLKNANLGSNVLGILLKKVSFPLIVLVVLGFVSMYALSLHCTTPKRQKQQITKVNFARNEIQIKALKDSLILMKFQYEKDSILNANNVYYQFLRKLSNKELQSELDNKFQ